ncbi:MAG: hypothetical protein GXO90_08420, partial [FCB group bacterium]|nr:hypothetical protein [FCB group bacterium]
MRKLLCLTLIPMMLMGQKTIGPLTFIDSKSAWNLTGDLGLGGTGGTGFGLTAELPPYGDLAFLKFLPGFGMKLSLGKTDGFYIQNALCVRAKYNDKLIAYGGAGVGVYLNTDDTLNSGTYIPIIVGADFFFSEK